jgi:hypothetical protein
VGGAIVVAVAVAAAAFVYLGRGADAELPSSFAGMSQVANEQVDFLLREFRAEADREGIDADMALYGSADVPRAALIWVQDGSAPSTPDAFDAFATGFNEQLGVGSLDRSASTTVSIGGISYLCAPVAAAPQATNICLWQDEGIFWILLDLSGSPGLAAARDLAVDAHDAVAV